MKIVGNSVFKVEIDKTNRKFRILEQNEEIFLRGIYNSEYMGIKIMSCIRPEDSINYDGILYIRGENTERDNNWFKIYDDDNIETIEEITLFLSLETLPEIEIIGHPDVLALRYYPRYNCGIMQYRSTTITKEIMERYCNAVVRFDLSDAYGYFNIPTNMYDSYKKSIVSILNAVNINYWRIK